MGLKTLKHRSLNRLEISKPIKEKIMRTATMRNLFKHLALTGILGLLATAATAQVISKNQGLLKVCKVAGPGVPVGTPFTITVDTKPPFTVPAGPAPGGFCVIGPTFPVGSIVTVTETLTNGNQLVAIKVDPPIRFVSLSGSTVHVLIGSGVTEVTFTNERTGYLQVCKQTKPAGGTGNYQFYVNGQGPYTVPAGACSPAIKVPAGPVNIAEVQGPGVHLVDCKTLPDASLKLSCNTGAGTSTVNVKPGDVSNQTVAIMVNEKHEGPIDAPTNDTNSTE